MVVFIRENRGGDQRGIEGAGFRAYGPTHAPGGGGGCVYSCIAVMAPVCLDRPPEVINVTGLSSVWKVSVRTNPLRNV